MTNTIFGSSLAELQQLCKHEGWPRYVAKQLCEWMYLKRVSSFAEMTNISLRIRHRLSELADVAYGDSFLQPPVSFQQSVDGTKKYLFAIPSSQLECAPAHDEATRYIETVYLPEGDRATLCVSCQAGCKMGCRFCVTGRQGFHGHLSVAHILNQIFAIPESASLTNIVYMGMGEPMDNYDNVLRSTQVLTESWGCGWSPQRITVSTVGVLPRLRQFVADSKCHIAVSMHNPFNEERLQIMPMQKVYPIAEVIDMLRQYDWNGQRRISFEYTMLEGQNDTLRHAAEIVRLVQGTANQSPLRCRVNLIRFHTGAEAYNTCNGMLRKSPSQSIARFQDYLNQHGIICTLRASRGEDIMAACGLLAGQNKM